MGEFVSIRGGPQSMLDAAHQGRAHADGLTSSANSSLTAVNALDHAGTFPPDPFTNAFLPEYYKETEVQGPAGNKVTTQSNDAVKLAVGRLGPSLTALFGLVTDAMAGYDEMDDGHRGEFEKTAESISAGSSDAGEVYKTATSLPADSHQSGSRRSV